MAKVQGKKAAGAARRAGSKVAARVKQAARAAKKRVAPRKPASRPAKPVKKAAKPAKPAPKIAKKVAKAVKKAAAALPSRPVAVAPAAAKAPVAPKTPAAPRAADVKKARARRMRPRVHSNGTPVAAWLPPGGEKPRPSSFIPAPPRAEAPSLIAAPPASSDRLIRPEDVTEFVTRTVPVRVDVEQSGGRVFIAVNPEDITLRPGEGIEWDFRYFGGADVTVEELLVEFEKPSPFSHQSFRSRKPGAARPHRQLSGAAQKTAAGRRVRYEIKAMSPFKTELATAKPYVTIQ
jgi:hypothetical protein